MRPGGRRAPVGLWWSRALPRHAILVPARQGAGELPKRPKGSDCKSDCSAFGGSNPSLATCKAPPRRGLRRRTGASRARRRVHRVPGSRRPTLPRRYHPVTLVAAACPGREYPREAEDLASSSPEGPHDVTHRDESAMADADRVVPSTRRSRRDGEREAEHRALYAESAQSSSMRVVDGGSPMYRTRREMRESASQLARDLPVIVEPAIAREDDVAPTPPTAPAGRRARRLARKIGRAHV